MLALFVQNVNAQTIELTASYNTIGVKVINIGNADSCRVEYKVASQTNWLLAYPPDKITLNGSEQFRGSIFNLVENTNYEVRTTIYTAANNNVLPVVQTTTIISPSFTFTSNQKWVSPNGTGNYTQANPGNLAALFSSNQISCGTTIVFTSGTYAVKDLQLNVSNNCNDVSPILLVAAPGATPIIDGGMVINSSWTQLSSSPNLYATTLPSSAAHTNICVVGNTSLYPYPTVSADLFFGNYNLSNLNFGYDGFVRDDNTIWIKTQAGINPNDSVVSISNSWRFLTVYGNNKNVYLKIKGLTFKNFGKPKLNPFGSSQDAYGATVFDIRNAHHIYFDSCNFIFNVANISFNNECNNITIQNTKFKSDAGKWSHAMIKKSHVNSFFTSTSRGRSFETEAIFFDKGKSICVRNNYFDGTNSGVQSYTEQGLKEEIDIYNNTFIDVFDAVENDGQWTNLRVWENEMIRPMAAFSAAPPLIGPRYFYRNLVHGMQGRRNEADDPHFNGCSPINGKYMSQAIGIKTNPIYVGTVPKGNLYFFNNTFHSDDTLGFVFTSWEAEWRKILFINNSFSHGKIYPLYYFDLADNVANGNFQINSQNDNYFSFSNTSPITKVKYIHEQYNCLDIFSVSNLQSTLSSISGSSNIIIQNPLQVNPIFENTNSGGFMLQNSSPLIDQGKIITGFYDYYGPKPDIGAKENDSNTSIDQIDKLTGINVYPNPTTGILSIDLPFYNDKVEINITNFIGQSLRTYQNLYGKELHIDIGDLHTGIYFVEIKTNNSSAIKKILKIRF